MREEEEGLFGGATLGRQGGFNTTGFPTASVSSLPSSPLLSEEGTTLSEQGTALSEEGTT